jgi:hypothetical protein
VHPPGHVGQGQALGFGPVKGNACRLFPAVGPELVVAEGVEDALAAAELHGMPAWAALSAGNMAALVLPARFRRVLILADRDEAGLRDAWELARRLRAEGRDAAVRCGAVRCGAVRCGAVRCGAVRCGAVRCGAVGEDRQGPERRAPVGEGRVVSPHAGYLDDGAPFPPHPGFEDAPEPPKGPPKGNGHGAESARPFVMMDDLALDTDVFWVIKDILPRGTMVMVYGRGGCGKTYLLASTAIGIASGRWFDHDAEKGAVLYCAFERPEDAEDRLAALRDRFEFKGLPIALMKMPGRPLDDATADEIIAAAKVLITATGLPVRAIMIDTVAAALGGNREDDEGLGRLRLCGERIHAETGAMVFWAHHEGKADNMGPRGHTTLSDAYLVWWHVEEREAGSRVVHVGKANRGPVHVPLFAFRLAPFSAGRDKRGKSIDLCEVQVTDLNEALASRARERGPSKSPDARMGAVQKLFLSELRRLARRHPQDVDEANLRSGFVLALNQQRAAKGEPPLTSRDNASKFSHTARGILDRDPPLAAKRDDGTWVLTDAD